MAIATFAVDPFSLSCAVTKKDFIVLPPFRAKQQKPILGTGHQRKHPIQLYCMNPENGSTDPLPVFTSQKNYLVVGNSCMP
jgi:hypothetical protein